MNHSRHYIVLVFVLLTGYLHTLGQNQVPDSANTNIYLQFNDTTYLVDDSLQVVSKDTMVNSKANYPDTLLTNIQIIDSTLLSTNNLEQAHDSGYVHRDSAKYSLNEYLFRITDSVVVEKWEYNIDIHNFNFYAYDSTLKEFHIFHPAYKKSINNNYLGNSGLAINSNIFFDANPETGFIFLKSFTPYLFQTRSATYYNVKKPYTYFGYQSGPKEEQNIEITHTQNVTPYLNGFFKFKNYTGKGAYLKQESKNNSGALGGAYTRSRFSSHLNFSFSRISVEENGGIVDPYYITDTAVGPSEMGIRLNDGSNYMKDRQWFFDQKIGFVKSRKADTCKTGSYLFSLQYNYQNQHTIRIYEDADELYFNPISGDSLFMYQHNYSSSNTFDTSSYSHNTHLLRLNLEEIAGNPLSFGAYVGIGKESSRYFTRNKDTLFIYTIDTTPKSIYAEGGIFRLNPAASLKFYGHYTYFLEGYRKNDFNLQGMVSVKLGKGLLQSIFTAEGKTETKTSDYFIKKYYSNHFRWNNNFEKENVTQLMFKYELPKLNTTIGARYALMSNYIYFDSLAMPNQFKSDFNVYDFYINSIIQTHKIGLITKINYQQSGKSDVLRLPDWSFYNALYFYHYIHFEQTGGTMQIQLGVDANYWTAFYAQAYSPATAQFYNQQQQKTGNYPFFGAFINLEIKRMRIFIKIDHLNYSYMKKRSSSNYFMAPSYPTPKLVTRYGISWTFYD